MGIPKGHTLVTDEIAGFWTTDTDIFIKPIEAYVCDNPTTPTLPSVLVICELLESCQLQSIVKENEKVTGKIGDRVGIWHVPALIGFLRLAFCSVYIQIENGFKIYKKGTGGPIPVTLDWRKRSLSVKLPVGLMNTITCPVLRSSLIDYKLPFCQ